MKYYNFYSIWITHSPKFYSSIKLLIITFILSVLAITNGLATAYRNEFVDDRPPLPDLAFDLISYDKSMWSISDYCLVISLLAMLSAAYLRNEWMTMTTDTLSVFCVIYLIRASCIFATSIPPPFPNAKKICEPPLGQNATLYDFFSRSSSLISMALGKSDQFICGDYIFGGHAAFYVISFMTTAWNLSWDDHKGLIGLAASSLITGSYALIASRRHYSVDIIVAVFIASFTFLIYNLTKLIFELRRRVEVQ